MPVIVAEVGPTGVRSVSTKCNVGLNVFVTATRQTAGIVFTHRPKIRFFAPQGRLVAPIHVKLGRNDGHLGPLGCAKFTSIGADGWECGPKNIKNFHFLVKSRPAGATPLTDFENF